MDRMKWTEQHDNCFVQEMFLFEPWNHKAGSQERGNCWEAIAEQLNSVTEVRFNVCQRAVRERYTVLEKRFKAKERAEKAASGIDVPEETNVEAGLRDIIDLFKGKKERDI